MNEQQPEEQLRLDLTSYEWLRVVQLRHDNREANAPNRYGIYNADRKLIAAIVETSGVLSRSLFKYVRFESLELINRNSQLVLSVKEKLGIPSTTHHAWDHKGRPLFKIAGKTSWIAPKFSIVADNEPAITVKASVFRRNNYSATVENRLIGTIKRHKPMAGYRLTRSDRYDISFNNRATSNLHRLMLVTMAVVLDMKLYEVQLSDLSLGRAV